MKLLLIKILFVKSVAPLICPNGYGSSEFQLLLYELGYGASTQICPSDNFLFSYICCDYAAYYDCCIRFEVWSLILMVVVLISISFCCFCFLFASILYAKQTVQM